MNTKQPIKLVLWIGLLFSACHPAAGPSKEKATENNIQPQEELLKAPAMVDSGQVWFMVNITRNDTPFIHYEGKWPLLLMSNNSVTIQLSASEKLMSISNMLTIYMHGLPPVGRIPVVVSGREMDKVSMIMSPVVRGNYDIPILPAEGFLQVTKNTGQLFSGNFEATAVDANKNNFLVTGTFLNVKVNDLDAVK